MKKFYLVVLFNLIVSFSIFAASLTVNVHNVNGNSISGSLVKLYDNNWNAVTSGYTNNSGSVTFRSLENGLYNYEVYYTGETQEFWGSKEGVDVNKNRVTSDFTRDWPFRYSYSGPPSEVNVNSEVTFQITVKNNLSFSRDVKVELWIDMDQASPWDFDQLSSSQNISGGGASTTFTFTYTPATPGSYYWKMRVLTYNDGAGDFIVTDSYFWTDAFSANDNGSGNPVPLTEGVLIYHNYSSYDAWDAELYMYDFATDTKTDLSKNWNIDHEMNANISPDGTKIVFMGDDKGNPRDWDIYIWDIGSANDPVNLTQKNRKRDEDPKFSPDGTHIVFKQNGDIKIMDLNGNITDVTNDGSGVEESMPYYTTDGQQIVYARGASENSDIYIMNTDGSNKTALYAAPGVNEYYPIVRDDNSFFYTRWLSSTDYHDQIYLGDFSGNSYSIATNDITADNSDAAPVGSDYLFFSSTRTGGQGGYDLYFGRLSTGQVWDLNSYGINSPLEELGACYSNKVNIKSVSVATNINKAEFDGIRIYPNPASEKIAIEGDNIQAIEMYNLQGQKISQKNISCQRYILYLNRYPKGMYILKIINSGKIITRKLVIK